MASSGESVPAVARKIPSLQIIEDYSSGDGAPPSPSSSSTSPWQAPRAGAEDSAQSSTTAQTGSKKLLGGLGSHRRGASTAGDDSPPPAPPVEPSGSALPQDAAQLQAEVTRLKGQIQKKDYDYNLLKLDVENSKRDLFVLRNRLETLKNLLSPSEEDAEKLVWINSLLQKPESSGASTARVIVSESSSGSSSTGEFLKRERSLSSNTTPQLWTNDLDNGSEDEDSIIVSSSVAQSDSPHPLRAPMSISASVLPSFSQALQDLSAAAMDVDTTQLLGEPQSQSNSNIEQWRERLSGIESELQKLVVQFRDSLQTIEGEEDGGRGSLPSSEQLDEIRKECERLQEALQEKTEQLVAIEASKQGLEEELCLLREKAQANEEKVQDGENQATWAREMALQAVQALDDERRGFEEEKQRLSEEFERRLREVEDSHQEELQRESETIRRDAAVQLQSVFAELEGIRADLEKRMESLTREELEAVEREKSSSLSNDARATELEAQLQDREVEHRKRIEELEAERAKERLQWEQEREELRQQLLREKEESLEKERELRKVDQQRLEKELESRGREVEEQNRQIREEEARQRREVELKLKELENQRQEEAKNWESKLTQASEAQKSRIAQLEAALQQQGQEAQEIQERLWAKESELTSLKEELSIKTESLQATEGTLSQLKKEMGAKDEVITRLSEEVKSTRRQSSSNNLRPTAATALWEEVERLRESNQAHQNQNMILASEIKRLQGEMNAKIEAKDGTIARLYQQIAKLQGKTPHSAWSSAPGLSASEPSVALSSTSPPGVSTSSPPDSAEIVASSSQTERELIEELAELKKKYFFALAMETKLHLFNTRKPCNVDIAELYQTALNLPVPHASWGQWLYQQFDMASKSR